MAIIIQLVFIVGIFYFLFIVPQRREQKKHREMVDALRPGDQVATAGGLVGAIVQLTDKEVTLKSGDAKIVVERSKVMRKLGD